MFSDMEVSADNLQSIRGKLHIFLAVLIGVAAIVEIALFASDTNIGPADGWYFALCFLSIPILLYQTLTMRFARSRKWANAYAFAGLDVLWAILWLTAFASVAAWNTAGECKSSKGCALSKTLVGLGFFIFLFFVIASAISVYGAIYYRRNGSLPGFSRIPANPSMIDPDRAAFSTAPHDEYAPVIMNDKDDDHDVDLEADHPRPHAAYGGSANSRHDLDTSYGGAAESETHAGGYQAPYVQSEAASYTTEPTAYTAPAAERVQFPAGNYH